ncbi:MAG: T9SS type A sorting domain-containing protein, partial [Bacteroidales bacterium]|nr:T9SS type A sorting domain-containing protein [Bacteroidales bacterium]
TNADGCASTDTLKLTVNHGTHNVQTETACETFTWHGQTYTSSGTYTHNYTNADGCASVDTLKLTVNHGTHNVETETACEAYTWHGQTYAQSGTYTHTYTNNDGCTSVDTLKLTVNYTTYGQETVTACDSFTWHGITYTSSGAYQAHLTNAVGCDSIVTLHLTVNQSAFSTETDSVYVTHLPYLWHGISINENGIYYDTLQTINGCDSICQLTLNIYGTGVEQYSNTYLQVYPNPASSHINIKGHNLLDVSLYDVRGALLRIYSTQDDEFLSLPLSEYADGLYILRIRFTDNSTTSRRIVIKR